MTLGRVVVLPEYRGRHLGARAVTEAERWIRELGYRKIVIDSRVVAVGFYEKLDYRHESDEVIKSGAFDYLTKPVDLKQFRAVVRAAVFSPEKTDTSVTGTAGKKCIFTEIFRQVQACLIKQTGN